MHKFNNLIVILQILMMNCLLYSQAPEVDWFRGYGTNTEEHVHEGMQTSDSGYIGVGHGIESSGIDDMLIVKIDKNAKFEWKQEFGTKYKKGAGYCITETVDGFIAGGAIFDPDSQRTQRFLTKIDDSGKIVWEKFYPSFGVGGIRGIDLTGDGGIIVTGYKNTPDINEFRGFVFIVDDGDGFIMKLDTSGNVEWEKSIDAPQGTKIREIESGYSVCATVWNWSEDTGDHQDFCLIKTDKQGETFSRLCYGGLNNDHLYDFDLTDDGGFILAGHTLSYGVINWDYLMIKVDSEGIEEWHKIFGQPRGYDPKYIHDEAYGVRQTPDGGYVISGGSGDEYDYSASGHHAGPSDQWKVYLVKTDHEGGIVWEGIYPPRSARNNGGEYIGLTQDGGYIVFVDTDSQTPPDPNNFGFLKLSPDTVTSISHRSAQFLENYELHQNYPNPFNPVTVIRYRVPFTNGVKLKVYNALGQRVAILVNEIQSAGEYRIEWDASGFPSGVFYYHLISGPYSEVQKMVLLR